MDAENRGEARGTRRRIWSRLRQRRSRSWILGASAIAVGVLLASAGTAYLLISRQALSTLDEYEVTVPSTAQDAWRRPQPLATATAAPEATAGVIAPPTAEPEYVFDFASAYPADQTNPKYWSAYEFAGSGPYGSPTLPAGFEFVSVLGIVRDASEQANPVRILIPAIGLDATVSELAIIKEEGGDRYEQPIKLIGHIPETPNPGQYGNGWYFGHLESPILSEGNVFRRLPEVTELMKNDPVDVVVETATDGYLYRVTSTHVIPKEELALYESDVSSVTLVASFPSRVYSHRLLVTAELIAARQ